MAPRKPLTGTEKIWRTLTDKLFREKRETKGDTGRQRETKGDKGRQRETKGDKGRQRETKGDRGRQRRGGKARQHN